MLKIAQCNRCAHLSVCRIYYQLKNVLEADITLSNCIWFSKVKNHDHIGNEVNVPTIQRNNRSIEDIINTTKAINDISKSTQQEKVSSQDCCSFCGSPTTETVICAECGNECCIFCATETGDINDATNQEKKYICSDCW